MGGAGGVYWHLPFGFWRVVKKGICQGVAQGGTGRHMPEWGTPQPNVALVSTEEWIGLGTREQRADDAWAQ